jgi:hypothetical protein
MRSADIYTAERDMQMRVAQELRGAEVRRLARQARPGQHLAISHRARWLLCELGLRLVAAGARLEAYSTPQYKPAKAKVPRAS